MDATSSSSSGSESDEEDGGTFPVQLVTSDARGRDYVASRDVAPNELVLRVAPVAAVPNDRFATSVCSGCFRRGCKPCPGCRQVALCDECAAPGTRAAALHRDECAALRMLFGSAQTRRLEVSANAANSGGRAGVRLLLRLLHTRQRQRAAAAAGAEAASLWPALGEPENCDVIEDEFDDVWDLEDHWDDFSDEVADRLVDMSKQAKYVLSADLRGNLEEYVSLLAHCYCNAFKLPGRGDSRTRLAPESVGVAVFVSASFFNHSCSPNCHFALDSSGFLEVKAARAVKEGELLTISYIPLDSAQAQAAAGGGGTRTRHQNAEGGGSGGSSGSRESRQEILRKNFFFDCACERCAEEAEAEAEEMEADQVEGGGDGKRTNKRSRE